MIGFITSLFGGFNWGRIIAIGAIALAVSGTIYAGYRYVNNLQEEATRLAVDNATLAANNAQLTEAVAEQQRTIESQQRDIELQNEIREGVERDFSAARDQVRALEQRLADHELGYLASQRPGLVENIINNATADVLRCFEIATGAPLTEEEINATLPSEINTECPDLANPNYEERP